MDPRQLGLLAAVVMASVVGGVGAVAPAAAAQSCSFPYTATDSTGTEVTVDAPPGRVVVLGPSAAQTMWDIGGREQVVGMPVNQYTSYLSGHERRANVMNPDDFTVNLEAVVNLSSDLVLAPNIVPADTVGKLRESGLAVYRFEAAGTIQDVYEQTMLTGRLTDNCEGARERVGWMQRRIGVVRQAVENEPRPRVIYPLGGGVVAGRDTFVHEIIVAAGGRNVAAQAGLSGYEKISSETIVARDPEWLILNEGLPTSAIQMVAYNQTTAVREGQIVRLDPNYANQPAPRIVYPIETIAAALHPAAYAAANATSTPTATTAATPPPTTLDPATSATAAPTEAPGQPGFGVVAAVVALAGLLLASRLRR